MCGIVGAIAERNVVPILVEGLRRLEYRGYDSAGVAVLGSDQSIGLCKTVGKVAELEDKLRADPLRGLLGVAHTRWATHGGVTEANAHPHMSGDRVAVIHNGIIENYQEIKDELERDRHRGSGTPRLRSPAGGMQSDRGGPEGGYPLQGRVCAVGR
jgi:glucosamine--fructose-6-phosphate aminotransferase (isomerizing)